jgi:hypothetical protein
MLQPLKEKGFTLTSNEPKEGMALNYLHLSLPPRMGKNPRKTWKIQKGQIRPNSPNR